MSEEDKKFSFTPDMLKEASEKMDHVETKERPELVTTQKWKCTECDEVTETDLPEVGKEDEIEPPVHHDKQMIPVIGSQQIGNIYNNFDLHSCDKD